MTLFWSNIFYKCAVMTLFRHNTQPKCATITLFPHMPFFRHQRVLANSEPRKQSLCPSITALKHDTVSVGFAARVTTRKLLLHTFQSCCCSTSMEIWGKFLRLLFCFLYEVESSFLRKLLMRVGAQHIRCEKLVFCAARICFMPKSFFALPHKTDKLLGRPFDEGGNAQNLVLPSLLTEIDENRKKN